MSEDTQKSIEKTADNLIKKHRRMIDTYAPIKWPAHELSIKHAIVSVNQILSIVSTNWGISYWHGVKKQIKSKIK